MILAAVDLIKAQQDELSRLDAAIGDGDHGTAICRAMDAAAKALDENAGQSIEKTLKAIGWAVMGIDGGSTGPLFGSLFSGMAKAAKDADSLDGPALVAMFEQGLAGIRKHSQATVGDKTLIDAIEPAVQAMRASAGGGDIAAILDAGAEAADEGAKATAEMQAKFGRAKNLGERSIGHVDPGAASAALLFAGFAKAMA
jgi:dihydroxyacetone kinase-like protein